MQLLSKLGFCFCYEQLILQVFLLELADELKYRVICGECKRCFVSFCVKRLALEAKMSKVSLNNVPSNPRINRLRTYSRVSISSFVPI